jgi:hypothetical protein
VTHVGRSAQLDDEQERRTTLLVADRRKKPRSTTGGMVAAACAGAALPHRELAAHRVRRAGRADDGAWDAAQLEGTK